MALLYFIGLCANFFLGIGLGMAYKEEIAAWWRRVW